MRQLQLGIHDSGLTLSSSAGSTPHPLGGSVNEIILAQDSALQPIYLLPLLAQLSVDERWLTWVAMENTLNRNWVAAMGLNPSQVLHIAPQSDRFLDICCKTLAAGTGHLVIEWPGKIEDWEFDLLQQAAVQGGSQALLIRRR